MLWMRIINDGTGDVDTGHYNIDAGINGQTFGRVRIENWKRYNGWHHLLLLAAQKLHEQEGDRLLKELSALGELQGDG